ncbi:MAG: alkaline phosphatase D family protein [Pseudomonadales bacterium]|nr:alkaline phosphatase D family protein [Pseudomonadales bacterium]
MNIPFPRRKFLKAALTAGAASGLMLSSWTAKVLAALADPERNRVFSHGVASGDPTHDSVLLWTRVVANGSANVSWELASDSDFGQIIQRGQHPTNSGSDHTVKVVVDNLQAGQTYYYRFLFDGVTSEPGRTRTLPSGPLAQLGIAVASCSNYPFGYFNAYEAIANDEDIDFVVHLGDYIYEYGASGWGAEDGAALNRAHAPAHEIVSLADYRERHGQYKSDLGSRLMHAAHPLIPTWDDHESANNPWRGGAENHQPAIEGDWSERREASLQAYFEWMPVRDPASGGSRDRLWRHFSFGDLASMTTLETRHTGRGLQVEYGEHLASISNNADRDRFVNEILGDPARDMLSSEMEAFLEQSLRQSVSQSQTWRIIGNQIPIARTHVPDVGSRLQREVGGGYDPVSESHGRFSRLGELDLPLYLDTWDGYPAARERFYDLCRRAGASDLIVITGDSHAFWANELFDDSNQRMGVELGTTGITSPGDFESYGPEGAAAFDRLVAEHNREVAWTDCTRRGFVKLMLTPDSARADFVMVDNVLSRDFQSSVLRSVDIVRDGDSLAFG